MTLRVEIIDWDGMTYYVRVDGQGRAVAALTAEEFWAYAREAAWKPS